MTEPVRVLRVIGRLNVGGPSLHVVYLSAGLAERGYDTTLVAGDVERGEDSMMFVADAHGVPVVRLAQLQREVSLLRDARAVARLVKLIRKTRPHILHTHTAKAGAVGRLAALLAGAARPPIVVHTFHGHVLRGYFDPVRSTGFRLLERLLARTSTKLIAVSPQVRDDLVALGVAPSDRFAVIRLGIEFAERVALHDGHRAECRRALGHRPGSVRRRLDGTHGRRETHRARPPRVPGASRERSRRDAFASSATAPNGSELERRAHELGIVATPSSSASSRTSLPITRPSTCCCSRPRTRARR